MAKKSISKSNKVRKKRLIFFGLICLAINAYVFYSVLAVILGLIYMKLGLK